MYLDISVINGKAYRSVLPGPSCQQEIFPATWDQQRYLPVLVPAELPSSFFDTEEYMLYLLHCCMYTAKTQYYTQGGHFK